MTKIKSFTFATLIAGCNSSPAQNCFVLAELTPEIPRSGNCEATGIINEDFGSYYLSSVELASDVKTRVYVGADELERGSEVKDNVGNEIRISGRFISLEGIVLVIERTETFEIVRRQ